MKKKSKKLKAPFSYAHDQEKFTKTRQKAHKFTQILHLL